MYKFKIGDRVVFKENMQLIFAGMTGVVKTRTNDKGMRYGIHMDELSGKFSDCIIPEHFLELLDIELLKERNRLKEEMRLAHIEIDPFGEEVW